MKTAELNHQFQKFGGISCVNNPSGYFLRLLLGTYTCVHKEWVASTVIGNQLRMSVAFREQM